MTTNTIHNTSELNFLKKFNTSTKTYQLSQGSNLIDLNKERKNVVAIYWKFTNADASSAMVMIMNNLDICKLQEKNYFTCVQQCQYLSKMTDETIWMFAFTQKPESLSILGTTSIKLPFTLMINVQNYSLESTVEIVEQYKCSQEQYDQYEQSLALDDTVKLLEEIYEKIFINSEISFTHFLKKVNDMSKFKNNTNDENFTASKKQKYDEVY